MVEGLVSKGALLVENAALQQRRPIGIAIIAIVLAVAGVLGIIFGIFTLIGSLMHPVMAFFGVTGILLGIIDIILAWGLWTLKRWAYWVTLIIAALDILQAIFSLFRRANFWAALFSVILPVIVLVYLLSDRNVRAAFHV